MRWIIIAGMILVIMPSAQALIVTPAVFEADVEHAYVYSEHFRVVPENISQDISIFSSSPFPVSFSENSILNLSTYRDIDFNITIPEQFPEGTYTSYIFVVGENQTRVVDVRLTIQRSLNFTASLQDELNTTTGDAGFLILTIANKGNDIVEPQIDPSIEANEFLHFSNNILHPLYPNISVEVPMAYTIPNTMIPGTYDFNVSVTVGNVTRLLPVRVNILDDDPPIIESVRVPERLRAGVDFSINVSARDNINVSDVILDFADNTTLTQGNPSGSVFRFTGNTRMLGDFNMTVTAIDESGNNASETHNLQIQPYYGVRFADIDYVQINRAELTRFHIFDSDIRVPFCFKMQFLDFFATPNASYEQFLYVDGIKETNSTCFNATELDFAFRPDQNGRLDTEFVIEFPDWVQVDETINIGTDVEDRTILRNQQVQIGSYTMNCTFTDLQRWHCNDLVYPGNIDLNELGLPLTEREFDSILATVNRTESKYELQLAYANGFSSLQTIIIILMIIGAVLYWLFHVKEYQILGVGF